MAVAVAVAAAAAARVWLAQACRGAQSASVSGAIAGSATAAVAAKTSMRTQTWRSSSAIALKGALEGERGADPHGGVVGVLASGFCSGAR